MFSEHTRRLSDERAARCNGTGEIREMNRENQSISNKKPRVRTRRGRKAGGDKENTGNWNIQFETTRNNAKSLIFDKWDKSYQRGVLREVRFKRQESFEGTSTGGEHITDTNRISIGHVNKENGVTE